MEYFSSIPVSHPQKNNKILLLLKYCEHFEVDNRFVLNLCKHTNYISFSTILHHTTCM